MRAVLPFLALSLAVPDAAAAAEPMRLQASSPWRLDLLADGCRMTRSFGSGAQETKLLFERRAPYQTSMVLIGETARFHAKIIQHEQDVPVRLVPETGSRARAAMVATTDGVPTLLWRDFYLTVRGGIAFRDYEGRSLEPREPFGPPSSNTKEKSSAKPTKSSSSRRAFSDIQADLDRGMAELERADAISISGEGIPSLRLETGALGKVEDELRRCMDVKLMQWGFDPGTQRRITQPAAMEGGVMSIWRASDYPTKAAMDGSQGPIAVRLAVEADGSISDCQPAMLVDEKAFDHVVCSVTKRRGKFMPAELEDGTKVRSLYVYVLSFFVG